MTSFSSPSATAHWSVPGLLREYLSSGRLAEVVYRDSSGQICTVHDVVRDLFSRAGHDYVLLGRGQMVGLDHLLTLDGHRLAMV